MEIQIYNNIWNKRKRIQTTVVYVSPFPDYGCGYLLNYVLYFVFSNSPLAAWFSCLLVDTYALSPLFRFLNYRELRAVSEESLFSYFVYIFQVLCCFSLIQQVRWVLFTITYQQASKNIKAHELTRYYAVPISSEAPEPILPSVMVVAQIVWDLDSEISRLGHSCAPPRGCPLGFRSRVKEWVCHVGISATLSVVQRK